MNERALPAERESTILVLLTLIFVVWGVTVFYLPVAGPALLPTIYATPLVLAVALILALRIQACGKESLPPGLLIAGCLFVAGGAAFDIFSTLHHSPDLAEEANPIARLLLDSDHSIAFVYVYGGFCQVTYISLICLLWAGFLGHRSAIVNSVSESPGPMHVLKALTGGRRLTWRQWMFPLNMSELPEFSFYIWIFMAIWVGESAYRWYLGLEWFGFSPVDRNVVGVVAMLTGFALYVAWAYREIQFLVPEPTPAAEGLDS